MAKGRATPPIVGKRSKSPQPRTAASGKAAPGKAMTGKSPSGKAPARKPAGKSATSAKAPPSRDASGGGSRRPAASAELIVRQGFVIDATGKGPVATPEVMILGNAEGFRYLASVFAALAEQAASRKAAPSPPVHLPRLEHPIHARFSDDLDFRFAAFNAANRKTVLKSFGIDLKSRQEGSLFERYQAIAAQFGRLSGIMRREGILGPDRPTPPTAEPSPPRQA